MIGRKLRAPADRSTIVASEVTRPTKQHTLHLTNQACGRPTTIQLMKTINSPTALSSSKSNFPIIASNDSMKRNSPRPGLRRTIEEEEASAKSSLLFTILEQFTCGPSKLVVEPQEVCYPRCTSPPMSPPVIYVHRYRRDEKREPAPRSTIKSFDTEITAATSTEDEESSSLWLLEDGKMIRWLDMVDGRATPVVSNISSMRSNDSLPRSLELQKCVCFDDEDAQEAPHAQSILMDNRNLLAMR